MPFLGEKTYVPVLRGLIFIIDSFVEDNTPGKSSWKKEIFLSLIRFFL